MRAIRSPSHENHIRQRQQQRQERYSHEEEVSQYRAPNQPPCPMAAPQNYGADLRTQSLLQQATFANPFHSPYVDTVGSIVGLRVLFIDGNMCYVPVEPHINYMINQQFGRPNFAQPGFVPQQIESEGRPRRESEGASHPGQKSIIKELQRRSGLNGQENQGELIVESTETMNHQHGKNTTTSSSGVSSFSGGEPMDDPPWMRPHPQPQNGKRGTAGWKNEPPKPSHRQPPGGYTSDLLGIGSASTTHSHNSYAHRTPHTYEPPRERNHQEDARERLQQPLEDYNPWGRGGCGAPLKDSQGNVVADRRRLGASWSRSVDTNDPHHPDKPYTFNEKLFSVEMSTPSSNRQPLSYYRDNPYLYNYSPIDEFSNRKAGSMVPMSASMPSLAKTAYLSPADQHRAELELQIQDNKRRKELERQKEIEQEKREIQRWEERNARIRAEEEEAKRKEREKALALEKRRAAMAEREAARSNPPRRAPSPQYDDRRRAPTEDGNDEGEHKLEWWEKKPSWDKMEREPSAIIPALRKGARTPSAPSRVNSAEARSSRQSYRAADAVREHSARRQSMDRSTPVQRRPVRQAEAFTIAA